MKNSRHHVLAALLLVLACILTLAFVACTGGDDPEVTTASTTAASSPATTTAATTTAATTTSGSQSSARPTYKVTVVDAEGNPIVGVEIQLCDGDNCLLPRETGEDGVVEFRVSSVGNWAAAFPEAPAGYTVEEKYYFTEGETELTIILTPAA